MIGKSNWGIIIYIFLAVLLFFYRAIEPVDWSWWFIILPFLLPIGVGILIYLLLSVVKQKK